MRRYFIVSFCALISLSSSARAVPLIIQFGDGSHNLANQVALQPASFRRWPNYEQSIPVAGKYASPGAQVFLSNGPGDPVRDLDFTAMIGDGGPNNQLTGPGVVIGPSITADVLTGTIFSTGTYDGGLPPIQAAGGNQIAVEAISTATTVASGLLATVYVDTTGFTHGTWELDIGGPVLAGTSIDSVNGNGLYDNANGPEGNVLVHCEQHFRRSCGPNVVRHIDHDRARTQQPRARRDCTCRANVRALRRHD